MSEGPDWVRAADAADLDPGDRVTVSVDGTPVGVLNVDGEYYALRNECPHQHGPVCTGKVAPKLEGEFVAPGERVREYHGDELAIACPWHGWEFDLATGEHLGSERYAVPTYDTAVRDGVVYVARPE